MPTKILTIKRENEHKERYIHRQRKQLYLSSDNHQAGGKGALPPLAEAVTKSGGLPNGTAEVVDVTVIRGGNKTIKQLYMYPERDSVRALDDRKTRKEKLGTVLE